MKYICYRCGGGERPENSLAAIENCIQVQPNWPIEMDLQMTKDQQVVLLHDKSLLRTTGVDKLIHDLTYEQVQGLHTPSSRTLGRNTISPAQVPLLETVLQKYLHRHWVFDIHSENPIIVDSIISLISKFQLSERVTIVSESDEIIKEFRQKQPNWRYAAATNEVKKFLLAHKFGLGKLASPNYNIIAIPRRMGKFNLLTKKLTQQIHKKNMVLWIFGDDLKAVLQNRKDNLPISSQHYSKNQIQQLESIGVDALFIDCPSMLSEE